MVETGRHPVQNFMVACHCLSSHPRCAVSVILSAGMPASGLEDRICTGEWVDNQYLLAPQEIPEELVVLVPAHLGYLG